MSQHSHELIVGMYVKLLYIFSLNVYRAGISQYIYKACFVYFNIHPLGSKANVAQQTTEFTGGLGKLP